MANIVAVIASAWAYLVHAWHLLRAHGQAIAANFEQHPVTLRVRSLQTTKLAFTLATSAIVAPVISDKFPTIFMHYLVLQLLFFSCAIMWIGSFYDTAGGIAIQIVGLSMSLMLSAIMLGLFMPFGWTVICFGSSLLFLIPFLDIIIRPTAGVAAAVV